MPGSLTSFLLSFLLFFFPSFFPIHFPPEVSGASLEARTSLNASEKLSSCGSKRKTFSEELSSQDHDKMKGMGSSRLVLCAAAAAGAPSSNGSSSFRLQQTAFELLPVLLTLHGSSSPPSRWLLLTLTLLHYHLGLLEWLWWVEP